MADTTNTTTTFTQELIAGGAACFAAENFTALLIANNSHLRAPKVAGLAPAMKAIFTEVFLSPVFAANLSDVARMLPFHAIRLAVYQTARDYSTYLVEHPHNTPKSSAALLLMTSMLGGAVAGATATALTNPIQVVEDHMKQIAATGSSMTSTTKLAQDAISAVVKEQGAVGLFYTPSRMFVAVPFSAAQFMTYGFVDGLIGNKLKKKDSAMLPVFNFANGFVASCVAQFLAAPAQKIVRNHAAWSATIAATTPGGAPVPYTLAQAASDTFKKHGLGIFWGRNTKFSLVNAVYGGTLLGLYEVLNRTIAGSNSAKKAKDNKEAPSSDAQQTSA
eukprot:GEZU01039817.1.p1 GENE.GEZU01039817.1~~GEZU01039817.1.p1  ORF type:complete len:333 (+),score=96.39 GEZU01039817.1:81-1079(+)